jgi:hypothetical protein
MRKVFSIILYVIAGFCVYTACLMAFINHHSMPKWGIVTGYTVAAAIFLCGGLAVNRFQNWRRHAGTVVVSAAGFTIYVIFVFLCLLMTDEFKQMMPSNTLHFFSAYVSGGTFVAITGALGILLLKSGKYQATPSTPPEGKHVGWVST